MEPLNPIVMVPGFTLVTPHVPYNAVLSRKFNEQYQAGYIRMYNDEHEYNPTAASPKISTEKLSVSHQEKAEKIPLSQRVADIYSPSEWFSEEIGMFEEFLRVYGQNFGEISRLLCGSKDPEKVQSYFTTKWISSAPDTAEDPNRRSVCHLCFSAEVNQPHKRGPKRHTLLVCGGCERGYHVACLIPRPPNPIPKPWYCSEECVSMSMLQCQICDNAENDEQMLLCDTCDRGYHMFCLNPPLAAIPEGDWNCPQCRDRQAGVTTSVITFSPPSRLSSTPTVCTHTPHHFIQVMRTNGVSPLSRSSSLLRLDPSLALALQATKPARPQPPTSTISQLSNTPLPPSASATTPEATDQPSSNGHLPSENKLATNSLEDTDSSDATTSIQPTSDPSSSSSTPPPPSIPIKKTPTRGRPPKIKTELPLPPPPPPPMEDPCDDDPSLLLDPTQLAASAIPHSLLALKHWGKEMCMECLIDAGLLRGDAIFTRRSKNKKGNKPIEIIKYVTRTSTK